ncbi:hypothetical protein GCM10007304_17500 [Rhodococcoides trifolii]|uniref:Uncharacterized protein n=1 Tax=Rhodococcoides trifolii TaxID=908250 RepID=A0A917CY32_9NOCA|nr:hypothetical protein [Rhodococcus trifolii]GGG03863.1 hypothetical protein GCM10007304_17500 [Rhodococcus trifolii]
MPVASKLTGPLEGKAGEAFGYRLSEPFNGVDYLIVTRIDWPQWGCQETRVVPASRLVDEDGTEHVVQLVDGEHTMSISIELALCTHEEALQSIGYTVTDG